MRKIGFLWAVFMAAGVSANPLDKAMRLVPVVLTAVKANYGTGPNPVEVPDPPIVLDLSGSVSGWSRDCVDAHWVDYGPVEFRLNLTELGSAAAAISVVAIEPCGVGFDGIGAARKTRTGAWSIDFISGAYKGSSAWLTRFDGRWWIRMSASKFGEVYSGYLRPEPAVF
ncbi:MAG: hypothetical protein UT11_C0028G0008 [Berkelbacteria bacterium GW2011_GWA2_38_9]|uniref:Uncharacterized protein n=1 Tax=Berkelbacteria bacterium GW2011_GWA2_38_9 TaxID=1618334 RepID=A0A0G0LBD8_9BACT|nr:MAG: hypothetical protein UT11_C0028G0008 [Berkelbacteria bacterium GW2011_GWA2_38_9]